MIKALYIPVSGRIHHRLVLRIVVAIFFLIELVLLCYFIQGFLSLQFQYIYLSLRYVQEILLFLYGTHDCFIQ